MNSDVLYESQKETAHLLTRRLREFKGVLLRGDEGVGKTIIASYMSEVYKKTLWVTKAGAKQDTLSKVAKYKRSYGLESDIDVVSYHYFANIVKLKAVKLSRYHLIIFDECQMLRNYSAGWTTRFCKLHFNGQKLIFMSATPSIKSMKDLVYVIRKTGAFGKISTNDFYIKYFSAVKSKMFDGFEFGEFVNQEDFFSYANQTMYELTQHMVDKDIPTEVYKYHELPIKAKVAEDITKETATRLANGIAKVDYASALIKKLRNGLNDKPYLVICYFHEVAKEMSEKLGLPLALDNKSVLKGFNAIKNNSELGLVTTFGLTSASLDLNECDHIYLVESTYSYQNDRQTIRRCLRVGKRTRLNVHYIACKGDRALKTDFSKIDLGKQEREHSKMGASALARLEKCPGSYWLPDTNKEIRDRVSASSIEGKLNHSSAERLICNPKLEIGENYKDTIHDMVARCRELVKNSSQWGCESRVKAPSIHEDFWGTCDFWSYDKGTLTVIDYKNGVYKVDIEGNAQLQAYALMCIETYQLKSVKKIVIGIQQKKQFKSCIINEKDISLIYKRMKNIVKAIGEASRDPIAHINKNECDFFCPARKYHDKNEVVSMGTKKKAFVKREAKPTASLEGKVLWVSNERQTSIPDKEKGKLSSKSFLILLEERPKHLSKIAEVERLKNSVTPSRDDEDKFTLFVSCLSSVYGYSSIAVGSDVECEVNATPTTKGEKKLFFNAVNFRNLSDDEGEDEDLEEWL